MSTSKPTTGIATIIGVAAILGLLLVGTGVHEWRIARQTEASVAMANQEYEAQQQHLKELQSQAHSADQARDALQKNADALRQAAAALSQRPSAPSGAAPVRAPARDPKADGQAFLAAFPEQRSAIIEIGKAQIARGFGPFYRAAGLSPAQIDQFETFMSEEWLKSIVVAPNSVHPDTGQLPQDQLHALLGDQAYRQYQDFNRAQGAYGLALQLATAVTSAGAPSMSTDQADQLAQIVLNNSPSYQSGKPMNTATVNWDAVMTQAQGVLSAPQMQVAEGMLYNMQYRTALNQAMRAQLPAAPPVPVSK
jgi:hypothetical protein